MKHLRLDQFTTRAALKRQRAAVMRHFVAGAGFLAGITLAAWGFGYLN